MCSMMPGISTCSPSQIASTSTSLPMQVLVDQDRVVGRHAGRVADVAGQLVGAVDDLHRPAAEHVGRPHEHRVADPLGDIRSRIVERCDRRAGRLRDAEPAQEGLEALAVLGQVDRVAAELPRIATPRSVERLGQVDRRLAAELDDRPAASACPSSPCSWRRISSTLSASSGSK